LFLFNFKLLFIFCVHGTAFKDSQVGTAIEELIDKADDFLWLISPYIRLHDKIKDKLKTATRRAPDLRIVVVFGKNEMTSVKVLTKTISSF
jgi:phosphatidylserine/phosphatidylglycerophosphate/cardiolipin synthase-like enzyme